jgi:hypothetical protein
MFGNGWFSLASLLGLAIVHLDRLCYLWLGLTFLWSAKFSLSWFPYGQQ